MTGRVVESKVRAKGRIVRASRPFEAGDLISADPIVELSADELVSIKATNLGCYWFNWPGGGAVVAFGLVSMMAHAPYPNARFQPDPQGRRMLTWAVKPIQPGEEITINYLDGDSGPLAFEAY